MSGIHLVTGAYGYSGRAIARRLLEEGHAVRTLTNSPDRAHPFGTAVPAYPMSFGDPRALARAFEGVDVFHNTYWVRFDEAGLDQAAAVPNTLRLFEAARAAGVRRVIHVSITNPSLDSPYPYFRRKAELERALGDLRVPHSILRPAVLFGEEDILVHNIAWALRHLPVFGLFGDGRYRIQPIHVDDLAALAVREAACEGNRIVDAVGPEAPTYRELVETIARAIGRRRPVVALPPGLALLGVRLAGWFVGEPIVTRDEMRALRDDLLVTPASPATGSTSLRAWIEANAASLGVRYRREIARRRDRRTAYTDL